jgi:hypothetical protein
MTELNGHALKRRPPFFELRDRFKRAISMADDIPGSAARPIAIVLLGFTWQDTFNANGLLVAKVGKERLRSCTGYKSVRNVDGPVNTLLHIKLLTIHKQGGARAGERYANNEYLFSAEWLRQTENLLGDRLLDWPDRLLPLPNGIERPVYREHEEERPHLDDSFHAALQENLSRGPSRGRRSTVERLMDAALRNNPTRH